MATDNFDSFKPGFNAPAGDGFAITPHNTNELTRVPRALYIGVSGTVVLTTPAGNDLTFVNLPSGSILSVRCTKVKATGTTATNLIGLD